MQHFSPPVVYIDAPLSYMVEGQAKKFYQGMAGMTNDVAFEDPSVINYFVISATHIKDKDEEENLMASINLNDPSQHLNGTRLCGMIPCSDAFGVDIIIEKYNDQVEIKGSKTKQHNDNLRRLSGK